MEEATRKAVLQPWRRVGGGAVTPRTADSRLPLTEAQLLQLHTLHAFLLHAPSSYRGVGFNLTGRTSAFTIAVAA